MRYASGEGPIVGKKPCNFTLVYVLLAVCFIFAVVFIATMYVFCVGANPISVDIIIKEETNGCSFEPL